MNRHIYILVFLTYLSFGAKAALLQESGDLESYLNGITFGSENDGVFKIPAADQQQDFESVVRWILQGSYELASNSTQALGYELVAYTDTSTTELFYLLREINPYPSPEANGGGIYIFNPAATYNAAIHAPHPKFDSFTSKGAISAFMKSDARYFMMAGAHRRSHPDPSSCQNFSDYRPSDAVHNTAHYFYVAHKAMEDFDPSIHYVELHGYSSSSLDIISSQCNTGGNTAVANISETISDDDAGEATLMHYLESEIVEGGEFAACIYSTILDTGPDDKYSRYLGGSTNTLSRYTNGSSSVCDQSAQLADNSHRYVHLEQSWDIRANAGTRELMADYISQAIASYFDDLYGKPFRINAGLSDAWYNPQTDGQGFFVMVLPDKGLIALSWFTYDTELPPPDAHANLGDAGHRWLNALGPIDGNTSVMEISIASGGLFDIPSDVIETPGGSIIVSFDDCNTGTVVYDIASTGQKGTVPIQRVASDNIALCELLMED